MLRIKYPLVSVIVPFFNEQNYIKESLESALNQTYKNIELILIDDGSTDKSFNIIKNLIKQDCRVKYFKKKNSKTPANGRNYGIRKAKGKFLSFLDADDIWKNNKLELQLKKIRKNHLLSCTAANYRILKSNSKSNFFLNFLRSFFQNFIIKKINHSKFWWLYVYNPIITSSVLLHRKVFNKFKFNENLDVREDLDFWILVSKKYKNFISYNKEILVTITRKKKSVSSEYLPEFNRYIITVNKKINEFKDFKYLNYLFIGISAKIIKFFIKKNYIFFRKNIYGAFFIFSFFYFIIFYSPIFWYLGNPLLYSDNLKKPDAILVSLGTGYTPYYNNSYHSRYSDLLANVNLPIKIIDIYIHGRKQLLPDQIILKSLLKNQGFSDDKIYLIFEERDSFYKNIVDLSILLKSKNVKSIIFITGPYNTLRAKLIWRKVAPEIEVLILKTLDWPIKNSFFDRSMNKKIIIHEYLSIIKTKLFLLN